jgi:hypothetical protein
MATFETALDECLRRINAGEMDVEGCLKRYPEYADELRPLLETAARMKPGSDAPKAEPPPAPAGPMRAASKASTPDPTAEIPQFADARQGRRGGLSWYAPPALRWAALVVIIVIALLLVGTAFAQTAYPGDLLYGWKRASENVVRPVNPVLVDLWISQRRANEVLAVRNDPARLAVAWAGYREVMNRLLAYDDPAQAAHIAAVLRAQWEAFLQAGVPLPTGTAALPPVPTASPTPTPTATALATSAGTIPKVTASSTPSGPTSPPTATRTNFVFPTSQPSRTPRPTSTSVPTWTPRPTRTASTTPFATWTPLPTFPTPCFPPPCQ